MAFILFSVAGLACTSSSSIFFFCSYDLPNMRPKQLSVSSARRSTCSFAYSPESKGAAMVRRRTLVIDDSELFSACAMSFTPVLSCLFALAPFVVQPLLCYAPSRSLSHDSRTLLFPIVTYIPSVKLVIQDKIATITEARCVMNHAVLLRPAATSEDGI